jgi:hypothetical protein
MMSTVLLVAKSCSSERPNKHDAPIFSVEE